MHPTLRPHRGRLLRRFSPSLLLLAAFTLAAPSAQAQVVKAKPAVPPPLDTRPLARYIARDNLAIYAGTEGLASREDAWKKTAAYRMLNNTPLGEMLESILSQLAANAIARTPDARLTGTDVVAILKHLARQGFVFAVNSRERGKGPSDDLATFVLRGAAGKGIRQPFSRLMGYMTGPSKPLIVKKSGRNIIVVPMAGPKKTDDTWAWWAEGDDLVVVIGKQTEDAVLALLDGKSPNSVDNPARAELAGTEGAFSPLFLFFIDPAAAPSNSVAHDTLAKLTDAGITRFDFRWGFQDDALMSITRLKAPKPRKTWLAAFDQPTFDKTKIPPLPEGLEAFTILSIDPAKTFDVIEAVAPPEARAGMLKTLDALKTKSRIDIRKDLLVHLGPKVAVYILPGAAPSRAPEPGASAPPAAPPLIPPGNPFAAMLGGMMGGLGGTPQIPRVTILAEVDDPVAFGKVLDNLMVAVNRQLKDQASATAAPLDATAAAGAPGAPPAGRVRGIPGAPGDGAPAPAPPEFRLMPGKDKVYTLNVPVGSGRLPAGFRPTIRLGAKHLAIAVSPDAARLALEVKPREWTPTAELNPVFDQLSRSLMLLNVSDPRDTLPETLATLPSLIQRTVNTVMAADQLNPGAKGAAGAPNMPGAPGGPAMAGNRGAMRGFPGAPGGSSPGGPGMFLPPGAPGAMSMPGALGQTPGATPAGTNGPNILVLNVDPAKLPKADDLRALLFPSSLSLSTDDQEVRLVSRTAFPNIFAPSNVASAAFSVALLIPAVQAARTAARAAAEKNAPKAAENKDPAASTSTAAPASAPSASSPGEDRAPGKGRRRP